MRRREFVKSSAIATGGLALAPWLARAQGSGERPKPKGKHPNLLIVFPDQMRAQAVGFMNEDPAITPNLDRFAEEGVAFTQAVSNYPVCSPFRAMLMTGRWPHHNGVVTNCNSNSAPYGVELREDARCWSDVLHDRGYSLGYIGKWHLDAPHEPYIDCRNNRGKTKWNEWCSPDRRHGFDYWYAYGTYDYHTRPMYWSTDAARDDFHFVDQWGPEHEADKTIDYLKNEAGNLRDPDRPFALVVSMNPPHTPYQLVPEKYVERYSDKTVEDLCNRPNIPPAGTKMGDRYRRDIRNYLAMVTGVDEQFGRILDALDEQGLADDTIVLFTSDHGNCLGIHNCITKNVHYEESMRVPFIVRAPGRVEPRCDDFLMSTPDIYPTLLDLMGFADAIPDAVDGKSRAEYLRTGEGEEPTSQPYIWTSPAKPAHGRRGVRTRHYKLVLEKKDENSEVDIVLHDLENDPYELKNIAEDKPSVVDFLIMTELIPWLKEADDPWLEHVTTKGVGSNAKA